MRGVLDYVIVRILFFLKQKNMGIFSDLPGERESDIGVLDQLDEEKTAWNELSDLELLRLHNMCGILQMRGHLDVLDGIPDEMRQDWLDESLKFPDEENPDRPNRATENISITADEFREMADEVCMDLVNNVCEKFGEDLHVVYPWRAALSFLTAFAKKDFDIDRHCHLGVYRDESTAKPQVYLPLDLQKLKNVKNGYVVIADPMLATGGSMALVIDQIKNLGVSGNKIVCVSVVAAPEGVARLTNDYPGLKVVTAALDGRLNSSAYIVDPGLGDFGDKYMQGLSDEDIRNMYAHLMSKSDMDALLKRRKYLELAA